MHTTALTLCVAAALAAAMLCGCRHAAPYTPPAGPAAEVPFTQVRIADSFWRPRIDTNRKVSIPSAFSQCEANGRFDNFAIAGGLMEGDHRGDFSFDDTDPYKVIEGASYSLAVEYDPRLDAYLDSVINLIAAAQEPDGYLTTCVTNKCQRLSGWWGSHRWEKINSHELYNSGHLYEAAVAHWRATGKRSLLDVAIKNADLVCRTFGYAEGQISYPSGHPIVEMALAKLYKATGDDKYLRQAAYFVGEAGRLSDGRRPSPYSQDHIPILQQQEIVGHAVRAGYLYSGVADVAALTADTAYLKAITRIWDNMASRKLYITGGIGSRAQGEGFGPDYELHNHTAYCETCAAIANVYWNHRMLLATGNAKYADVLERALYNGVLSGVSLSGDRFFYDNPLESMGQHERQPWFGCACCPGNVTRFMASIPQYVYATQKDDILVDLYIQGQADIITPSNKVGISQSTSYPWSGEVEISVEPEREAEFALRLRIPGWAGDAPVPSDLYAFTSASAGRWQVMVNGRRADTVVADGYATLKRKWKRGDKVTLSLPMEPRQVKAHEKVVDDRGKLALQRGPVVYCLEGADRKDSTVFDKYIPEGASFSERFEPDLLGGVMTLTAEGCQVLADGSEKQVELKAVPYCVWNNRGPGQMAVWIPSSAETAVAPPAPTLAGGAMMYSEPTQQSSSTPAATSNLSWGWGYNDRWEPRSSSDTSKPYHYWWLRRGTEENVCYRFDGPKEISSVDVYWLAFEHYDGDYDTPESWTLLYRTADNRWEPVAARGEYTVERDRYNRLEFDPVITTDLKLQAKLRPGMSGGVIEWKVNP